MRISGYDLGDFGGRTGIRAGGRTEVGRNRGVGTGFHGGVVTIIGRDACRRRKNDEGHERRNTNRK